MKNGLIGALMLVFAAALFGLVGLYAGWYNVAATQPHTAFTEWALGTLQHNSVSARAADLDVSLPSDSAALEHGFVHYDAMCADCHGAPGVDRGETGQGMTPTPPDLAEEVHEWTDAELFWITKHGIKLAGMPAFGPTHSDEELLGIVAFMREMEEMTANEYAAWRQRMDADSGAIHVHPDGSTHRH